MGHTTNPDIRIAKSVVDYIFRWMGIHFLAGYKEANSGIGKIPAERSAAEEDDASVRLPAAKKAGGPAPLPRENKMLGATETKVKTAPPVIAEKSNGHSNGNGSHGSPLAPREDTHHAERDAHQGPTLRIDGNGPLVTSSTGRSEQFARFQLDAPSCDNCGAITVRNGNCYLCHNCGSSMGCS
jgi:ribonucleoside-diphosphate reductase alpha chain